MEQGEHLQDRVLSLFKRRYENLSSATDMVFSIPLTADMARNSRFGNLSVPGWIRERAAEILFNAGDGSEAEGLPQAVLNSLLRVSMQNDPPYPMSETVGIIDL